MAVREASFASASLALAFAGLLAACDPATQASQQGKGQEPPALPAGAQARVAEALDPCAGSAAGFARSVCANRALSALDTQIRNSLAVEAGPISEAGMRVLIENQQDWRNAQRIACGVGNAPPDPVQVQCLEQRFRARAAEAANTIQTVGGFTLQEVALIEAAPTSAAMRASDPGIGPALVTDVRFPRIDGEQTQAVQRANALLAQRPQSSPQEGTYESIRYTVAYAGPALISVRYAMSADTPSEAQSSTNMKAVNVVMATGQALTAADVFRAASGWENFITQRAVRDLSRRYREYDNFVPPDRDVRETVTKPHLWVITESALVLLFPPLSFGGDYSMGSTEVTIPWTDLRRYLNPNAPAPIGPQA